MHASAVRTVRDGAHYPTQSPVPFSRDIRLGAREDHCAVRAPRGNCQHTMMRDRACRKVEMNVRIL